MLSENNIYTVIRMKHNLYALLPLLGLFLLVSCNKDEGEGGSSSLGGYVYQIRHFNDNSLFPTDTIPAAKEDVFIVYGDNEYFGDDIETNDAGYYKFEYLRKGNYTVFAYSSFDDDTREAEYQQVKVGGGYNRADTIYIHTGKASGTAMIRGKVMARYYDNGRLVTIDGKYEFPAIGYRVYLKYAGQDIVADDVRTNDEGIFVFQRLQAGTYEIYTETEMVGDGYKNVLFPTEKQTIVIPSTPYIIHDLEKEFVINLNI